MSLRTIRVKEGDTLSGIAERELGNAYRWPQIYRLNYEAIGEAQRWPARRARKMEGPDWIFPGTELQLPERKSDVRLSDPSKEVGRSHLFSPRAA